MEKRIGTVTLLVNDRSHSQEINAILSQFGDIILCRQGLPFRDRPVSVISLIVEGSVSEINAMTGQLGRIPGVGCKAVVAKQN